MKSIERASAATGAGRGVRPLALDGFVPYRLSVLANRVSRSIARLYAERFGLAIPEWRTMAVLGEAGPLSAGDVAERTAMDKVRVTRALQRLARRRLLTRAVDTGDRRRAVLRLTPAGEAMYRAIVPLARAAEAALLAPLDAAERVALDRLLTRLTARARALEQGVPAVTPGGHENGPG